MTRIIAGTAGGRRLAVPDGRTTRPTSDRAREALFASALSDLGSLAGLRVLDLYAGSGAIGLEALSRGAEHVLLVEADRRAADVIRRNISTVDMPGAHLVADRVERLVDKGPGGVGYDFVVADPPYPVTDDQVTALLIALHERGWLASDALVVVERPARGAALLWPDGYEGDRVRKYGEAALWYGHAASLRDQV
ncbi:16S rRNA (guanine(966)-N(2))-methyltransferase RsmD [Nocardiopsis ansamitocini]|uniref:DNA methylase n=1 Tax=Nocardiopsis ansamitocini TaxID=1670832 RepID=A0A9W6P3V4_9ACTN|nr:16S rRNA (guanine(966)-N(2))-methyltransferase RsmD [Nocardiopsis ansamitocini]GLU46614.1 DNA methylase [Nocardiopsis ansamitocini]